jgi:hypothetical protein
VGRWRRVRNAGGHGSWIEERSPLLWTGGPCSPRTWAENGFFLYFYSIPRGLLFLAAVICPDNRSVGWAAPGFFSPGTLRRTWRRIWGTRPEPLAGIPDPDNVFSRPCGTHFAVFGVAYKQEKSAVFPISRQNRRETGSSTFFLLLCALEALVNLVPVHRVPPGRKIIRPLVLVFEVVGVLPDIVSKNGKKPLRNRVVLVG